MEFSIQDNGEVKEEELKEGEVEPEVEKQEEVMEDLWSDLVLNGKL